MNDQRRLDSLRDLSKGQREYLKRQGIRADQFDRLSTEEQHEWKEEVKDPSFEHMLDFEKHVKKVKPYQIN